MILPTKQELDSLDMSEITKLLHYVPEVNFISEPAGVNHYRLLLWLAKQHTYKISDIGTYMGFSAMCFASNIYNKVITYDTDFTKVKWKSKPQNVQSIFAKDTEYFDKDILKSEIIFVDTWHEGNMERAIYEFLAQHDWKGILIYDDIYYNEAMTKFWKNIGRAKIDATEIGHSTGTGIIEF